MVRILVYCECRDTYDLVAYVIQKYFDVSPALGDIEYGCYYAGLKYEFVLCDLYMKDFGVLRDVDFHGWIFYSAAYCANVVWEPLVNFYRDMSLRNVLCNMEPMWKV